MPLVLPLGPVAPRWDQTVLVVASAEATERSTQARRVPHVSLESYASQAVYPPPMCVQNASVLELTDVRHERSKAHRRRPTVKPELESLTDRILPSASIVTPAAM